MSDFTPLRESVASLASRAPSPEFGVLLGRACAVAASDAWRPAQPSSQQ